MNEKDLQQKYVEFQMIEEQLKQATEQIQELNNKILELDYLKKSIDEFSELKNGSEILAPISSGIFVKAKILESSKMLVNVGHGTVVEKDIKGTQKLLDQQAVEVEKLRVNLLTSASKLSMKSEQIESELRENVQVSKG